MACRAQIQQRITQGKIQQLAFPLCLAGNRRWTVGHPDCCLDDLTRRGGRQLPGGAGFALDNPAPSRPDALRQRPDPAFTGPVNINGQQEIGIPVQVGKPGCFSIIKGYGLASCHRRRFDEDHGVDPCAGPFGKRRYVILHDLGKGGIFEPYTEKSMIFDNNKQRMQTHRLQAAGIKQGQVEASPQPLRDNRITEPDPLAALLKTGRRQAVHNIFSLEGTINSGNLFLDPVGVVAHIAIQRRIAGPFPQQGRGSRIQAGNLRVIGCDKRRQQFRENTHSRPLVISQQLGRQTDRSQQLVGGSGRR